MNDDTSIKELRAEYEGLEWSDADGICLRVIDQLETTLSDLKSERDRADRAEAELKIHQHWHEEAIKLQGPEPGRTPSMVNAWVRNLMSRLDSSKARVTQLARELELMHDIAISHSGRIEELETGIREMVGAGGEWRREAKAHHNLVRLLADSRGATKVTP